jgi:hypothetical protein
MPSTPLLPRRVIEALQLTMTDRNRSCQEVKRARNLVEWRGLPIQLNRFTQTSYDRADQATIWGPGSCR